MSGVKPGMARSDTGGTLHIIQRRQRKDDERCSILFVVEQWLMTSVFENHQFAPRSSRHDTTRIKRPPAPVTDPHPTTPATPSASRARKIGFTPSQQIILSLSCRRRWLMTVETKIFALRLVKSNQSTCETYVERILGQIFQPRFCSRKLDTEWTISPLHADEQRYSKLDV